MFPTNEIEPRSILKVVPILKITIAVFTFCGFQEPQPNSTLITLGPEIRCRVLEVQWTADHRRSSSLGCDD